MFKFLVGNTFLTFFGMNDIRSAGYKIVMSIESVVYNFIAWCYQVFLLLARARIFDDEFFKGLINRFYVVFGVVMMFFIVYSLLMVIVNPDNMTKGNLAPGKIISNVLTSVIILALLPTAFNLLYQAQNVILDNDLIGRIVIGGSNPDDTQKTVQNGGRELAVNLFNAFFYPAEGYDDETVKARDEIEIDGKDEKNVPYSQAKELFISGKKNFLVFTAYSMNVVKGEMEYHWFINSIAGGFCLFVVISFVFDLGIRAVKLGVLQLIAPVPILMRCIPGKDKAFSKWLSTTMGCFFEIFIRIFVVYMIALIGGKITDISNSLFNSVSGQAVSAPIRALTKAFLLMGVVAFAKKAPKMISEVLGVSSDMSIGIKDKLKEGGAFAAGAIGASAVKGAGHRIANGDYKSLSDKTGFNKFKAGVGNARKILLGGVAGGVAGGIAGAKGSSKIDSFGAIGTHSNHAADAIDARRKQKEMYRKTHGDSVGGVLKGHWEDFKRGTKENLTGQKTGVEGRIEIAGQIKNDFESIKELWNTPKFQTYKAELEKLEATRDKFVKGSDEYIAYDAQVNRLKHTMNNMKLDAISKNQEAAGMALFNMKNNLSEQKIQTLLSGGKIKSEDADILRGIMGADINIGPTEKTLPNGKKVTVMAVQGADSSVDNLQKLIVDDVDETGTTTRRALDSAQTNVSNQDKIDKRSVEYQVIQKNQEAQKKAQDAKK